MLHLRRRIAFGMDIGDLLKLKRALEGYGEVISAAEINEVLGIGEDLREVRDPFVFTQHALYLGGNLTQLTHDGDELLLADRAFLAADTKGEHREGGHLRGEGFRGCNTDLRSYVGITTAVGHTRD